MSKKLFALAATSALLFVACTPAQPAANPDAMMKEEEGVMVGGALMVRSKNIVENAAGANNVTTLVAAVKAAGLVATLSEPGPFTVFAPTNDAFDKLPEGSVANLLKPENKDALVNVLTYHVVSGKLMGADLKDGMTLKTVQGDELKVTVDAAGKVWINGVNVIIADVVSSNGVTHVIDTVLLPPADEAMMDGTEDAEGDAMMKN